MSKKKHNSFSNSKPISQKQFSVLKTGYYDLYPIFGFSRYSNTKYFTKEHSNETECNLHNFLESLSNISKMKWKEIIYAAKQFHYHIIPNEKKIYKELFNENEEIPELYQFKLTGDRQSRIIGYFDSIYTFQIVAYDYKHQIYPQ